MGQVASFKISWPVLKQAVNFKMGQISNQAVTTIHLVMNKWLAHLVSNGVLLNSILQLHLSQSYNAMQLTVSNAYQLLDIPTIDISISIMCADLV